MKAEMSDADRMNPSLARRWKVSAGWSHHTIVVAAGPDEAMAVAAVWFAKRSGKTHMAVPRKSDYRVREASDKDVEIFLSLLVQDRRGLEGAKSDAS